jgi:hypothetical protein
MSPNGLVAGIALLAKVRVQAWLGAVVGAVLSAVVALAAGSPILTLQPASRASREPPMRIVRVTSAEPACQPNCPQWISAEGIIAPGSASTLAKVIAGLAGRRLPVLISSHGGSVRDAAEMGALIRAKGLAVAVARTLIANCPERAPDCPDARGQAIAGGAFCASACPLVLAGGVERLVGPAALVGVHQMTTVMKETEGVEHLTRTVKLYEQGWIDERVQAYLTQMGIGDPVMALLRKTPAATVRWLDVEEMSASHLATEALDPAQPILTEGASGLNGRAFGPEPARPDALIAKGASRDAGDGPEATLAFAFRRGGGAVEVTLTGEGGNAERWTLALTGGEPLPLRADGTGRARAVLPRDQFCTLARGGRILGSLAPGVSEGPAARPIVFEFWAMDGARILRDEACPSDG